MNSRWAVAQYPVFASPKNTPRKHRCATLVIWGFFGFITSLISTRSAMAGSVAYSNRTSFTAATIGLTTIDFEGIAPAGGSREFATTAGLTVAGVTFKSEYTYTGATSPDRSMWVVDSQANSGYWSLGTGDTLIGGINAPGNNYNYNGHIDVFLPSGVRAVGVDYSVEKASTLYHITLSTGETFTGNLPGGRTASFVGITSDMDISSIRFDADGGEWQVLDNFSFGGAAVSAPSVPLPSVAWAGMSLLGMVGSKCLLRRRRLASL